MRKLTFKDGIVFMEETQTNGSVILCQYPTQGQEITMTEDVWKDAKATGKTYSALRQMVSAGKGGGKGKGGGGPETFTKIDSK